MKKHLDLLFAAFVALAIVLYVLTIDFILHALHLICKLLHLAYEWFELGIEHAVEHFFILSVMAARSSRFTFCC
ncbi:MAG: hypothetical protein ACXV7J_03210 [Methylomonas sp.]